jgi:hypothetical protein
VWNLANGKLAIHPGYQAEGITPNIQNRTPRRHCANLLPVGEQSQLAYAMRIAGVAACCSQPCEHDRLRKAYDRQAKLPLIPFSVNLCNGVT